VFAKLVGRVGMCVCSLPQLRGIKFRWEGINCMVCALRLSISGWMQSQRTWCKVAIFSHVIHHLKPGCGGVVGVSSLTFHTPALRLCINLMSDTFHWSSIFGDVPSVLAAGAVVGFFSTGWCFRFGLIL